MNIQSASAEGRAQFVVVIDKKNFAGLVAAFAEAASGGDAFLIQLHEQISAVDPYYKQAAIMLPYQAEFIAASLIDDGSEQQFNERRRQGKIATLEQALTTLQAAGIPYDKEAYEAYEKQLPHINFHGQSYRVQFNVPARQAVAVQDILAQAGADIGHPADAPVLVKA